MERSFTEGCAERVDSLRSYLYKSTLILQASHRVVLVNNCAVIQAHASTNIGFGPLPGRFLCLFIDEVSLARGRIGNFKEFREFNVLLMGPKWYTKATRLT